MSVLLSFVSFATRKSAHAFKILPAKPGVTSFVELLLVTKTALPSSSLTFSPSNFTKKWPPPVGSLVSKPYLISNR